MTIVEMYLEFIFESSITTFDDENRVATLLLPFHESYSLYAVPYVLSYFVGLFKNNRNGTEILRIFNFSILEAYGIRIDRLTIVFLTKRVSVSLSYEPTQQQHVFISSITQGIRNILPGWEVEMGKDCW